MAGYESPVMGVITVYSLSYEMKEKKMIVWSLTEWILKTCETGYFNLDTFERFWEWDINWSCAMLKKVMKNNLHSTLIPINLIC